jgi:hypothetical protein
MEIEVRRSCNDAPPLNRPSGLASTTVPEALAPEAIAVFPSTTTGLATVAVKVSPGELSFEPTVWPRRTVITVPAGTTRGFGASCFMFAISVLDMAEPGLLSADELAMFPPGADEGLLLSLEAGAVVLGEFESGGAAGLLQPSRANDK